jgi:hypothetical protein
MKQFQSANGRWSRYNMIDSYLGCKTYPKRTAGSVQIHREGDEFSPLPVLLGPHRQWRQLMPGWHFAPAGVAGGRVGSAGVACWRMLAGLVKAECLVGSHLCEAAVWELTWQSLFRAALPSDQRILFKINSCIKMTWILKTYYNYTLLVELEI